MKTVELIGIEAENESVAVCAGRAVMAALAEHRAVVVADNDLTHGQWGEMVDYLTRRGARVTYDHDMGLPVVRA
jgi:predicted class III extradiol MEMO1 family dioxygenase